MDQESPLAGKEEGKHEQNLLVPRNLHECINELEKFLSKKELEQIRNTELEEFRGTAHSNLGLWIRSNFKLYQDTPLTKRFKENGVYNADTASNLILTALHKHLKHGGFDEGELFSLFVPYRYGEEKENN